MTGFYKEYDDTSGAYVSSAEDAAAAALVSENAAAASATAAAASEVLAGNHETAASTSETNAATSATNAATSATNASTSETNAAGSATAAAGSASSASTDAGTATTKASEASTSATNAATSETNAATSATNAATSETNAATSATNSASSATTASTQATNAASSATAAATSETNAGNSATAAATSETNAASSATSSSGSATTATTKAGEASTSATNAATSETNAATSATNSANSATSAGTAQTAAEAARDAALAAFDSFDDRYLGQKASNPTVDNDGNALVAGTLYFNTTTDEMKVYDGSTWLNAYASLSGALLATSNLSDLNNAATARTNLGLGTASTTAASDYATAAQADQTVALTGAGTTTISGTYPNFTITGAGTTYTAGTGLTLTGAEFSLTNSTSYMLNNADNDTVAYTNKTRFYSNTDGGTADGHMSGLEVYQGTVNADAFMSFHVQSGYAGYFGLDKSTNDLFWGGWSNGAAVKNKIWHAGNDGSGSGLDADTVDGKNTSTAESADTVVVRTGSGYLHAQYFNGTGTFSTSGASSGMARFTGTNGSDTYGRSYSAAAAGLLIGQSGGMSDIRTDLVVHGSYRDHGMFGTYDSNKTAQIWSMGTAYRNHSSGTNFGNLYGLAYKHTNNSTGGNMASGHQMVWCQNGTAHAALGSNIWTSGNVTAYSDIRVKKNIERIPNALDKVCQLNGYTFERTDVKFDNEGAPTVPVKQTGVIAQEVLKVLPEAVTGDEESHYSVAYGNMVGLLIEAIKELKAEVDELKGGV